MAELMISIHVDGSNINNKKSGLNIWVSKDEFANSYISKAFASVIIQSFNNNYPLPVPPQPMQRNKGIWVLQASNCPAVLIEAGNIANKKDLAFLQSDNGKEIVARNVLKGIEQYLNAVETKTVTTNDTLPVIAIGEIDTKKALIIENGKIIGFGEDADKDSNFKAETVYVKWLKPTEAMAKYGEKARYGACELTYSNKVSYKAFDEDKQLIILNGKVIGTGIDSKAAAKKLDVSWLNNVNANITTLQPKEAIKKYGNAAEFGASEITYFYEPKKEEAENETLKEITPDKSGNKPLYVIDGKITTIPDPLKSLSPESIDRINVFKGASAVKTYGARGVNGVVEIFTKVKPLSSLKETTKVVENVEIKEITSDKSGNKPLYIIDGKIMIIPDPLKSLSSDNIDRINVLKGASAVTLYGAKGVNGVVEIFTKLKTPSPLKETIKTANSNHLGEIVLVAPKLNGEEKEDNEPIFTMAENNPTFPGGDSAWKKYLMKNLRSDMPIIEGWKAGVYKIIVSFIVKKDGSITDVKTDDYPSSKTAEQCVNMIKNGPKWVPAIQNGHKVNCYKKQPITFVIEGQN